MHTASPQDNYQGSCLVHACAPPAQLKSTTTTTTKTTTASKTKKRLNDVKLQEVTNKTSSLDQLKYQRRMDCLFG